MDNKSTGRPATKGITRQRFLTQVGVGTAALAVGGTRGLGQLAEALASPLPSGYLHTQGSQIVDANNTPVRLAGVNWYGMDCDSMVPGGLDQQSLDSICQKVVALGFNSIRVPLSVQVVQDNPTIWNFLDANPALQGLSALEILDAIIQTAGGYGLKVILDNHRSEAGWSTQSNGLWYTQPYPAPLWLSTWQSIVQRYANNPTVIGADLRNEVGAPPPDTTAWPQNHGAEWGYNDPRYSTQVNPGDWAAAATQVGNAILDINPNLLIFVEGVRYDPSGPWLNGTHYLQWFGGNLMGVAHADGYRTVPTPIVLSVSDRLVYSAHDYGYDAYNGLAWCQPGTTAETPDACRAVWDQSWGYIVAQKIAPVWIGEFGTPNGYKPTDPPAPSPTQAYYTDPNPQNPQGAWFSYLVQYIKDNNISWCYWALNGTQSQALGRDPSAPDWYGVLRPDWTDYASQPMMDKLSSIQ
ncbi:MAG: hypothetical protein NVS2B16_11290 [Chloroflexota bacterium]